MMASGARIHLALANEGVRLSETPYTFFVQFAMVDRVIFERWLWRQEQRQIMTLACGNFCRGPLTDFAHPDIRDNHVRVVLARPVFDKDFLEPDFVGGHEILPSKQSQGLGT